MAVAIENEHVERTAAADGGRRSWDEDPMIARDVSQPTIAAPGGATGSRALLLSSLLLLIGP